MRRFQSNVYGMLLALPGLPAFTVLCLLASGLAPSAWAQATNDDFAHATAIYGEWGSIVGCNTNATAQRGEPNHAGFAPTYSIWYKWMAPADGEVSMDTFGSHCLNVSYNFYETNTIITNIVGTVTNIFTNITLITITNAFAGPMDTILAVYTGSDLTHLTQVAANDDVSPYLLQKDQYMSEGFNDLPFGGPSGLRFNAVNGTTYYIAIHSKGASTANSSGINTIFGSSQIAAPNGFPVLNWAYHSSGLFRFASEQFNWSSANGVIPMYYCTPYEDIPDWDVNYKTYYNYFATGVVVTVTRLVGSTGRVLVDYATADGTAVAGFDYMPVSGTLVFDDFEMSKDIVIPILGESGLLEMAQQMGPLGFDFSVYLSNPRLDPAESLEVSPPRLDLTWSNATVQIQNYSLVMDGTTNRDVFNFSHVHYRFPEDVNTYYSDCLITVYRTPTINEESPARRRHPSLPRQRPVLDNISAAGWDDFFPLEPGCDYATPTPAHQNAINGTNSDYTLAEATSHSAQTLPTQPCPSRSPTTPLPSSPEPSRSRSGGTPRKAAALSRSAPPMNAMSPSFSTTRTPPASGGSTL